MLRDQSIFLVGLSGSGKSTIGRKLAEKLKVPFIDSDNLIEKSEKRSINDIFVNSGEKYFRKIESKTIEQVCKKNRKKVVALGGGAFQSAINRKLILSHGVAVYLSCSIKILCERLAKDKSRPLLNNKIATRWQRYIKLAKLLEKRKTYYELADIKVSTSKKTINKTLDEILLKLS